MTIATLTLNPAVDLSINVGRVEPTRKLRAAAADRDPGGGGINAARVIARLGGEVVAVYTAGGAIGDLLRRLVAREAIPDMTVAIGGDTREDLTVRETETSQEYRFVLPGPVLTETEWRGCIEAVKSMKPAPTYIVASGSLPPGVPDDFYASLARTVARMGARLAVDTSGPALAAALEEGVFLAKPNLRELQDFTGTNLDTEESRLAAARQLIGQGRVEILALTLGEDGGLLVTGDEALRARSSSVTPVSAVGAGDSFLGAMVHYLSASATAGDAFRYGIAAGTAALLTPGTALSRKADVERLVRQVSVSPL